MKSLKLLILVAGLFATPAMAQEEARLELTEDPAIEVMILGVYHFANPGLDVVNMEVDDVLAPRRQREIQDLVDALAEWRPTKIALEDMAQAPALVLTDYERTEELLATDRSETVQVGYRLARQLGHEKVYGYDERATDGEPDYFPMGQVQAFAQENGGTELLGALFAEVQAVTAEEQANLPNQTIAQSLRTHNDAVRINAFHDKVYYSLLKIGNGDDQPGAELNAFWYMRNAKMFAKVDMIAEPGDRVLLIAGSGHATWLRHFVERMPGYKLIEALPYLEQAVEKAKTPSD